MNKLKENKFSMMLFIATIVLVVTFIVSIVVFWLQFDTLFQNALAHEKSAQSLTDSEKQYVESTVKGIMVFAYILSAVLTIFLAICGFKCALKGEWRMGAIVLGSLYIFDDVRTVIKNLINGNYIIIILQIIYTIAAVFYVVAAIKLKEEKTTLPDPHEIIIDEEEF